MCNNILIFFLLLIYNRESFTIYTQELQSSSLSLLLRVPNYRHEVGQNREKWVLNPAATSVTELEMFAFLGKLMGVAIRSKEYLDLNFPSIIWYEFAFDASLSNFLCTFY
jgi:hypothetical protein